MLIEGTHDMVAREAMKRGGMREDVVATMDEKGRGGECTLVVCIVYTKQ